MRHWTMRQILLILVFTKSRDMELLLKRKRYKMFQAVILSAPPTLVKVARSVAVRSELEIWMEHNGVVYGYP